MADNVDELLYRRASSCGSIRVSLYHAMWLANEKTKVVTSQKSFSSSGSQTLFSVEPVTSAFEGYEISCQIWICAIAVSRCKSLEIRVIYRKLCTSSRKRGNSLSVFQKLSQMQQRLERKTRVKLIPLLVKIVERETHRTTAITVW